MLKKRNEDNKQIHNFSQDWLTIKAQYFKIFNNLQAVLAKAITFRYTKQSSTKAF